MSPKNECNKYRGYPKRDNAFAQCGLLVHELLEAYFNGKVLITELPGLFEEHYDDYVFETFPKLGKTNLYESYFEKCYNYLDNFEGFDQYEILGSEVEFEIDILCGHRLKGYIDLLLRDKSDGRIVILDFKSKSNFKSKKELAEYARQFYLYTLYVYEKYGEYPKKFIFEMIRVVPPSKVVEFDMKAFEEAQDWMYLQIDKIEKMESFPAVYDKFYCESLCNFRASCPEKGKLSDE